MTPGHILHPDRQVTPWRGAAAGIAIAASILGGCATTDDPIDALTSARAWRPAETAAAPRPSQTNVQLTAFQQDTTPRPDDVAAQLRPIQPQETPGTAPQAGEPPAGELLPAPMPNGEAPPAVAVTDVIASIHATFPLLEAAYMENQITAGKELSALGAFDTKLKAGTENGPLGFYENYRHKVGLSRALYDGSEVFGGYRVGRGDFEPWYLERQTNEGGEFKAGVRIPLLRNREIDARRAELWRASYDRQRAIPEIRAQLIDFVRDGSVFYWNWVAAGRKLRIGEQALDLAETRNEQLKRLVDVGQLDPPVYQDNLRSIASREAKVIDLRRKLEQAGYKLSLFYRSAEGIPIAPKVDRLADFPTPADVSSMQLEDDTAVALMQRPELAALDLLAQRVQVDLDEAQNNLLPQVDAQFVGSQDIGLPTSKKRDKSQFELEAGIFVDVPLERRKALGKAQAAEGKLVQLSAKRTFTEDKIRAEIQGVYAALRAAFERLGRAKESVRLARLQVDIERRKLELGGVSLLPVILRERILIEAAEAEVDALFEYFSAKANYDAAMARDWPE